MNLTEHGVAPGKEVAVEMRRPSSMFTRAKFFRRKAKIDHHGEFVFKNKKTLIIVLVLSIMESFTLKRGFGNIRKFQGAAFLIPFIFMIIFLGLPLMASQVFLGQYGRVGILRLWRISPIASGIGHSMLIACILRVIAVSRTAAVSFLSAVYAMTPKIPWSDCDFVKNNASCFTTKDNADNVTKKMINKLCCRSNTDSYGICPQRQQMNLQYSSFVWFKHEFFDISRSIIAEGFGTVSFTLAATLAGVWFLIFLTLQRQIRILNKIMVPLGIILSIMFLLILLIVFIGGGDTSLSGIKFFFEMKTNAFMDTKLWIDCVEKAYESYHLICGSFIIFSSYAPKHSNAISVTVVVGCVQVLVMVLIMLMYSALGGLLAFLLDVPPACIHNTGWQSFIPIPTQFFSSLPYPQVSTILYYMFFFALNYFYIVLLLFAVVESVLDIKPKLREYYLYIILGLCLFCFLFSLPLSTQSGSRMEDVLQLIVVSAGTMVLACYAVIVMWLYGVGRLSDDIFFYTGSQPSKFWTYMWYFSPIPILYLLVPRCYNNIFNVKDKTESSILQPFKISFLVVIVCPILIAAIYQCTIYFKAGHYFAVFLPAHGWGPDDKDMKRRRLHFNPRKIIRFKIDSPLKHKPAGMLSRKHLKVENDRLESHRKIFLEYIKSKKEEAEAARLNSVTRV